MRVSCKWLAQILDLSLVEEEPSFAAEILTQRGIEVEAIERQDRGLEKVVTAQILERNPHPQADRLSLCKVTTGPGEVFEIVCGAQNMKAGDKVALARVGALLPNGMKIGQSKIRGVQSDGMLCSEEELKFKDTSEGILILPPETQVGLPLAKVLAKEDILLALKLTANRGDCLSHYGIAREVGAALARKPTELTTPKIVFENSPISVQLEAGGSIPQFHGVYLEGVKIGPSPEWLVQRLESLGFRSINNVVDATNLTMLEMGHPTHAYDADSIQGKTIIARTAENGESLPLLDGTTVVLNGTELVIADAKRPIALAGVMGGGNSEVQPGTTRVFLECAEFDATRVRKASTQHQKRTEASHRFERGVNPVQLPDVISRLAGWVIELAGGEIRGAISVEVPSRKSYPDFWKKEIRFGTFFIHDFLGFPRDREPLTLAKIEEILIDLDCTASRDESGWKVIPPAYRLDLSIREDIAEEIARSLGYGEIPSTIPVLSSPPTFASSSEPLLKIMDRAKQSLVKSGFHETINFSFTSRQSLSQFGMESSLRVLNPLSEEHEVMVPSLIPGLVDNVLKNWNHHFGSEPLAIRLFELRPVFSTKGNVGASDPMTTGVVEKWKLALVMTGPRYAEALRAERGEVDFYDLKAVFDSLLTDLGSKGIRTQPLSASRTEGSAVSKLFHPGQSVEILAGKAVAGTMGLLHPGKARQLKTRAPLWMLELDWDALIQLSRKSSESPVYKPWSEFPPIERDFALLVGEDVSADKLCQIAVRAGKPIARSAKVFDVYRGNQVAKGMTSVAVRVIFYDDGRSLQESEAETASARILEVWKKELGAELRS